MKKIHISSLIYVFLMAYGLAAVLAASLPYIIAQPSNQTVTEGQVASFTVVAQGQDLSYQWYQNGRPVLGATGSTYVILQARRSQNGTTYHCQLTNASGSVESQSATLTVQAPPTKLPTIVTPPRNRVVSEGEYAIFSIVARGQSLSYQWLRNGKDILGATGSQYTILMTGPADNKSTFRCRVQNAAGATMSPSAILTVRPAKPRIKTEPQSITVTENQPARFSIAAIGSHLHYQWLRNRKKITGATQPTLTISNCRYQDDGDRIQCLVRNAGGQVVSRQALLSVFLRPPVIIEGPKDVSLQENHTATFTLTAKGTELNYQWQKNGQRIKGAAQETYTTPMNSLKADGQVFACLVSNSGGSVLSKPAKLSVTPGWPIITRQPESVRALEGDAAEFSLEALGSGLIYQWQKNGVDIPDANQPTYTLSPCNAEEDGIVFRCIVSNQIGAVISETAALRVDLKLPTIIRQPQSIRVTENSPAQFSVTVRGTQLSYQWQFDDVDISGADSNQYTIGAAKINQAGRYQCQIRNSAGVLLSDPVLLSVTPDPPQIIQQPQALQVTQGHPATFGVKATGALISYQWQKNEVDIPGATQSTFTFYPPRNNDPSIFRCVVSNPGGQKVSEGARLSIKRGLPTFPVIVEQPQSKSVTEGQAVRLTIAAAGSEMHYQWQKERENIPGANTNTFTIEAPTLADKGRYRCLVSNGSGEVASLPAELTVTQAQPPTIIGEPQDVALAQGETAEFTVVTEDPEATYQWQCFDCDIEGATQARLELPHVTSAENDNRYRCIVSNKIGSVYSREATLTIIDTTPPELILLDALDTTTRDASVSIRGYSSDWGLGLVTISISSGNDPTPLFVSELKSEGDFSCDIPLHSGNNQIDITATDSHGNSTVRTLHVIREDDAE